jgi:hypothetical protein
MADMDDKLGKGGGNNENLATTEEFEKDLKLNTSAFEVLERDFQDVRRSLKYCNFHLIACIYELRLSYYEYSYS